MQQSRALLTAVLEQLHARAAHGASPATATPVPVCSCQDYQAIVDAEWNILYDKLDKIHKSGAKVVLSKLPIGDVATQYFADRDMFCAGRVPEEDLKRTMMVSTPGLQESLCTHSDTPDILGIPKQLLTDLSAPCRV